MNKTALLIQKPLAQAMSMPPSAMGDFRAYARFAESIPNLTREEEVALGRKLRDSNDLSAAQTLILSQLKMVTRIVKDHAGYGMPPEDLAQEGTIGLMKAVKKFNPEKGVRLFSWAQIWVKAAIQEYILENWKLVRLGASKNLKKLFFNLRKLRAQMGEDTQGQQTKKIAKKLGVKEAEVIEAGEWFAGETKSLDSDEGHEGEKLMERLNLGTQTPEELALIKEEETLIPKLSGQALGVLGERERRVIEARFGLSGPELTLKELSKELNVSMERVRQVEIGALKKMRAQLETV